MRTAGFIIDSHSCYRSVSNFVMKFGPIELSASQVVRDWPALLQSRSFATATDAIEGHAEERTHLATNFN